MIQIREKNLLIQLHNQIMASKSVYENTTKSEHNHKIIELKSI